MKHTFQSLNSQHKIEHHPKEIIRSNLQFRRFTLVFTVFESFLWIRDHQLVQTHFCEWKVSLRSHWCSRRELLKMPCWPSWLDPKVALFPTSFSFLFFSTWLNPLPDLSQNHRPSIFLAWLLFLRKIRRSLPDWNTILLVRWKDWTDQSLDQW